LAFKLQEIRGVTGVLGTGGAQEVIEDLLRLRRPDRQAIGATRAALAEPVALGGAGGPPWLLGGKAVKRGHTGVFGTVYVLQRVAAGWADWDVCEPKRKEG